MPIWIVLVPLSYAATAARLLLDAGFRPRPTPHLPLRSHPVVQWHVPILTIPTELAALTSSGDRNADCLYPGTFRRRAASPGPLRRRPARPHLVVPEQPIRRLQLAEVAPSISVHSEFANITRTSAPIRPLTCIVIVELPSRRQDPDSGAGYRAPPGLGHLGTPTDPFDPSARRIRRKQSVKGPIPSYYAAQTRPMSAPVGLSSSH